LGVKIKLPIFVDFSDKTCAKCPDEGRYIHPCNFMDQDISILRVDGDKIVNTGKSLSLPGHPASIRSHFE